MKTLTREELESGMNGAMLAVCSTAAIEREIKKKASELEHARNLQERERISFVSIRHEREVVENVIARIESERELEYQRKEQVVRDEGTLQRRFRELSRQGR